MPDVTINDLAEVTTIASGDFVAIWRTANADTRKISRTNFFGATLTGGGTIATAGYTLTISGTSTINGSVVGSMTGSGTVATGGYTLTVPATGTAVLLTATQTLTNKTLTAPIISTISNTGTVTLPSATTTLVGRDTTDTLTNKTLTTPTISATGFTNAQHAHTGATSGGQLTTAALSNLSTLVQTTGTQSIAGNKTFTNDVTVSGALTAENLSLFTGAYAVILFDSVTSGANTKIQVDITRASSTTNIQGGQFDVRMTGRVSSTVKGGFTTISWNGRNSNTIQYVAMNTAGSMVVTATVQTNTQLTLTFDLAPGGSWNEFSGSAILLTPASATWTITCTQIA